MSDFPEYHEQGMGCGLEDQGITDRYEACRYGYETALEDVNNDIVKHLEKENQELKEQVKKLVMDSYLEGIADREEDHRNDLSSYSLWKESDTKRILYEFLEKIEGGQND